MVYHQYDASAPTARRLRRMAGGFIKALREREGLTQADVSEYLGLRYHTFVSQVERGISRVPPWQYHLWAELLGEPLDEFAKILLSYYDPFTYQAIFGKPRWLTEAGREVADELRSADAASHPPGRKRLSGSRRPQTREWVAGDRADPSDRSRRRSRGRSGSPAGA